MSIQIKRKLKGYYKLSKIDADGNEVVLTDWFPNLITNTGMDNIGAPPNGYICNYCGVGTGTSTPAFTDTTLQSEVAIIYNNGSDRRVSSFDTKAYVAGPPAYWSGVFKYTFGLGQIVANISEVGVGTTTYPTATFLTTFSRALIVDGSGNPTTIPLGSTDTLIVYYELRIYFDTTDNPYSFVMNSVTYSGMYRPIAITTIRAYKNGVYVPPELGGTNSVAGYNGALVPVTTDVPTGAGGSNSTYTPGTYTNGTYTFSATAHFTTAACNLTGGITVIVSSFGMGAFQFSVSPAIPKDNTYTLDLVVAYTWARY